jgi:hypothetical protein
VVVVVVTGTLLLEVLLDLVETVVVEMVLGMAQLLEVTEQPTQVLVEVLVGSIQPFLLVVLVVLES